VTAFLVLETQGELYAVRWALVREAGIVSAQDLTVSSFTVTPRAPRDWR
jgi:hypothetical protein